jgi:hypothetical protein
MFIVSHLDEIKSWATKNVKIRKENNISSIVIDELKGEE